LGLPEVIIGDARSRVNTENASFEDAIAGLESIRITLERERDEASVLLRDARRDRIIAQEVKNRVDREHEKAAENAKREATRIINDARKTAEAVMDELQKLQRNAAREANWQSLNESKADLFRKLNEAEHEIREIEYDQTNETSSRELLPGDRVKLRGLGTLADVISISREGILSLQAGIMRITAHKDEVILVENETQNEIKIQLAKSDAKLREITAKPEIDLRGMTTGDAVPLLDLFIDSAIMAKLVSVTIIHGKGTGAMRNAVQQHLRQHSGVKSFRLGVYGEGEDGVTIVEL
jgi:DNA mismatch repair protein MutS2